jgi:DNA-binding transcriptional regulator YdaS (Cro superfamily)
VLFRSLAFYTARKRQGDNSRLSLMTGLSESHISNVTSGRRSINNDLADAMYSISRRRVTA